MTGESSGVRRDLRRIFDAAIAAVDPARLMTRALSAVPEGVQVRVPENGTSAPTVLLRGRVGVFGAGKAAVAMATAFERVCTASLEISGAVIAPVGADGPDGSHHLQVLAGEHPIPGPRGVASTASLLGTIAAQVAAPVDQFVCLLSGGASSLLVAPLAPLTLADKQAVTELMLRSGAAIEEINTVRKHLSAVKGGRLLRLLGGRPVASLILSDVIGDDPATIGSGPAVPDCSTYAEAIGVLRRRDVYDRCPAAARGVLERGLNGEIAETVRPDSREGKLAVPVVIGSNATARGAAAGAAARLGYRVENQPEALTGDTGESARRWLQSVLGRASGGDRWCFVAGGETTVRVTGNGKGGRNQEFALALVEPLRGRAVSVLSAGTDGIDGPTDAAGAYVDGASFDRAAARGLAPGAYLRNNDSYRYFKQLGDLLRIGPTGSNVMDLKIALVGPASAP